MDFQRSYNKTKTIKKLLTILLLLPLNLFAQKAPVPQGIRATNYYHCCTNHNPCMIVLDADEKEHNCKYHIPGCSSGGPNSTSEGGAFSKSPLAQGVLGATLGALAGSFAEDRNGKSQWESGASLGMGVFMGLNLLLRPVKRSRVENILLGSITVGSLAYGTAKMAEAMATPTTSAEPDKAPLIAAGGAVVGALVGMTWHIKLKPMNSTTQSRKKRFMSDMVFNMAGNKVGIIVRL